MMTLESSLSDALSASLSKIRLKALATGGFNAGGRWAVQFPAIGVLRFHVICEGSCLVQLKGEDQIHNLGAGDCFLVAPNREVTIASDLALKKKTTPEFLIANRKKDGITVINDGGSTIVLGVAFTFEGHLPLLFFGSLPSIICIQANADQATVLRWGIEHFRSEVLSENMGRALALTHLAPLMLLQTLRVHLASQDLRSGWLRALVDPKLSKVLNQIHSDYQRSWSLEALAEVAGMSRANFALNFKRHVGVTPMEYLNQWRMQVACELLRDSKPSVVEVANAVGYDSQSAFSAAFQRIVKCRPGTYRKNFDRKS